MTYWNMSNDEFILSVWPEAESLIAENAVAFDVIMSTANAMCVAYAPALPVDAVISDSFKLAEIFMARDIWNQAGAGNRTEYGTDGMPQTITRMNYLARDILRPKTSNISRLR